MAEEFKLTDWLQKAKEDPKQAAVPVGVVILLGFLLYRFFYAPKSIIIAKELKKNKSLINEMKNFQNAASQIEDIKINIEDKKKQWENTKNLCYKELERTQFLRKIRELATKSGINVKSVNPQPDEDMSIGPLNAKKFSVSFSFNDNMIKLLTFMRLIELESKICYMPIPTLVANASGTFDTTLTVSTILLPDVIPTNLFENADNDEDEEEE